MGFNAAIMLCCDNLNAIENDPAFGKRLADAIRSHGFDRLRPGQRPWLPASTQVLSVHHADETAIVAVGGNTGRVVTRMLGWGPTDTAIAAAVAAHVRRYAPPKPKAPPRVKRTPKPAKQPRQEGGRA